MLSERNLIERVTRLESLCAVWNNVVTAVVDSAEESHLNPDTAAKLEHSLILWRQYAYVYDPIHTPQAMCED